MIVDSSAVLAVLFKGEYFPKTDLQSAFQA